MELITVATFSTSVDLHITKNLLEQEGIECFVKDEYTVTANPLLDIAVGGIKLQVLEQDAEAAKAILNNTTGDDMETPSAEIAKKEKAASGVLKLILLIVSLLFITIIIISKAPF